MAATDVSPSRIAAARTAARIMIKGLPKDAKVGLISFARDVRVLLAPTDDRAAIDASLNRLALTGGTALGPAIDRAVASLRASHAKVKGRAIVVISDGKSTEGTRTPLAAARAAKAAGVRVFTVSLGTANGTVKEGENTVKVPPDPTTLRRVAATSGARFYRAADAKSLQSAYRDIGSAVKPAAQEARHQLRVRGRRRRARARWQPALAGLVPPPDLTAQRSAHVELAEALAQRVGEQRAMAALGLVLDAQQADAALGDPDGERVDRLARVPADVGQRSPRAPAAESPRFQASRYGLVAERPVVRVLDAALAECERRARSWRTRCRRSSGSSRTSASSETPASARSRTSSSWERRSYPIVNTVGGIGTRSAERRRVCYKPCRRTRC